MQNNKNTIGFFNKENQHSKDMEFKPNFLIKDTYDKKSFPVRQTNRNKSQKKLNDERRTLRVPAQQYYELLALLELSANNRYTYELIAELVDSSVKENAKHDPEFIRAYQAAIERIKMTDERRHRR